MEISQISFADGVPSHLLIINLWNVMNGATPAANHSHVHIKLRVEKDSMNLGI